MTHGELQDALERLDLAIGAAEAHGRLCGALCVRGIPEAGDWLRELATERNARADATGEAQLRAAHDETLEALRSPEFSFAPLLPGDEAPLGERVAALASWCDGFLYGFGSGAAGGEIVAEGEIGEYLGDLADIARAELEPDRSAEAVEGDFAELYEFVRAGTQLAWEELNRARSHAAG